MLKSVLFILNLLIFSLLLYIFIPVVYADVSALDSYSQGANLYLDPDKWQNSEKGYVLTNVSMDYEKVEITYEEPKPVDWVESSDRKYLPTHVSILFKMRNTSDIDENLEVFFPAVDVSNTGFHYASTPYIRNFKINGAILDEKSIKEHEISERESIPIYAWFESFPARQTKELLITYDSVSAQGHGDYFVSGYVIGTGNSWKGNIGKAEFIYKFPRVISDFGIKENLNIPGIKTEVVPHPYTITGNTLYLTINNYEPHNYETIHFNIFDFDLIAKAEELKKPSPTSANLLKLALVYADLGSGAHCYLCMEPIGDLGRETYIRALNAAKSKDEVLKVLDTYNLYPYGERELSNEYKVYTTLEYLKEVHDKWSKCDSNDLDCKFLYYNIWDLYDKPENTEILSAFQRDPFHYINKTDFEYTFLKLASEKLKTYDKDSAKIIDNYLAITDDFTTWSKDYIEKKDTADRERWAKEEEERESERTIEIENKPKTLEQTLVEAKETLDAPFFILLMISFISIIYLIILFSTIPLVSITIFAIYFIKRKRVNKIIQ